MTDWKSQSTLLTPQILHDLYAGAHKAQKTGGIWAVEMEKALHELSLGNHVAGTVRDARGIFIKIPSALTPRTLLTLEGEYEVDRRQILCRGAVGELWQQKPEKVARAYIPTDIRDGIWTWHKAIEEDVYVHWAVVRGFGTWHVPCPWNPTEFLYGLPGDVLVFKDGIEDCYPIDITIFIYTYKPL